MSVFFDYEKEVLEILVRPQLGEILTSEIVQTAELIEVDHTGVGYFLTLRNPSLPTDRIVLSSPDVHGSVAGLEFGLGFVVFIEDHEMTLECHSWADEDVPSDIRQRQVVITTRT